MWYNILDDVIGRIKEIAKGYPKCSAVGLSTLIFILVGLLAPSWLSNQLKTPAITLLRGVTFSLFGLWAYKAGNKFFKHLFDHEFQSKEKTQLVLVFFMLTMGMLSDPFTEFYTALYSQNHLFTISGVLVLGTRYVTNAIVDDWKLLDQKPVTWIMYSAGIVLLMLGHHTVKFVLPNISLLA